MKNNGLAPGSMRAAGPTILVATSRATLLKKPRADARHAGVELARSECREGFLRAKLGDRYVHALLAEVPSLDGDHPSCIANCSHGRHAYGRGRAGRGRCHRGSGFNRLLTLE
jgi:hypothetical protein